MSQWTPRDRVLAAVKGQEVLPVPVDVFENGLYPKLDAGLRRRLELQNAGYETLLRALGAEFRWCFPEYIGPELPQPAFDVPASYPARRVVSNIWGTLDGPETYAEDLYPRPLRHVATVADVTAHTWPDPDWFDYGLATHFTYPEGYSLPVAEWATRMAYARIAGGWCPVFSRMMDLCGFEHGLVQIAANPAVTQAIVGKIGEFYEEYYRRLARAVEGHADFLGFGDDFADQRGLIISPQKWRAIFLPLWRRLFAIAHRHGLKPIMHMCGHVRPVLGDLIDAGLAVCEVMQVTARGMEPVELKREFGSHLTFYGGINTQGTLPYGTPEDVRREVRERIEAMARGGRYVLASMHFLMDDVPPENAIAMYDEARSYQPSWSKKHG